MRYLSDHLQGCRELTFNDFPSVFIPKDISNMAETKAFAAFLFQPAGYIRNCRGLATWSPIKSIASDPDDLADPIIQKYKTEVNSMAAAAAAGKNLGFETEKHKPNRKAATRSSPRTSSLRTGPARVRQRARTPRRRSGMPPRNSTSTTARARSGGGRGRLFPSPNRPDHERDRRASGAGFDRDAQCAAGRSVDRADGADPRLRHRLSPAVRDSSFAVLDLYTHVEGKLGRPPTMPR